MRAPPPPGKGRPHEDSPHQHHTLKLAHQATLRIEDPSHLEVICLRGRLWLTVDHDQRDIVLEPNTRWFTTGGGDNRCWCTRCPTLELSVGLAGTQVASTQVATMDGRHRHPNPSLPLLPLAPA